MRFARLAASYGTIPTAPSIYGEVLCTRRRDRGVSVPGDKNVAILRPLKANVRTAAMSTPGFTAETSLYRTSASYRGLATGSDRLTGGIVTDRGWTPTFGREVAWVELPGGLPSFLRCG